MGFFKPSIDTNQPESQATPLAGDVLGMIRKQITGGTFGEGFGPLQREAGTGVRQYLQTLESGDAFSDIPTMESLTPQIEEQVGNLREGMGISGSRFGSSASRGEGQLRSDMITNIAKELSGLRLQKESTESQAMLQTLGQLFGMGQQNVQPAFDMTQLGILPEDTIVGDSQANQIANLIGSIAAAGSTAQGFG